jgi:radical S-adenosyl methionine domain-containing protein 2
MDTDGIIIPVSIRGEAFNEEWASPRAVSAGTTSEAITLPPSVNYHLWAPCNMRCRFCFAPFQDVVSEILPKGHLPREESIRLTEVLATRFAKVSFAGGEPTLCPWLPDLVRTAKECGATTMLVTNGSRLPQVIAELKGVLDWVAVSVDSASQGTLVQLGRAVKGRTAMLRERYVELAEMVRQAGIRLKINSVVTSLNASEDMSDFIRDLAPERWKILRVLPVDGQNDGRVEPLLCGDDDFAGFVKRHQRLGAEGIAVVPEDNEDMRGSYAMVDPAGRFFDNASGGHSYSAPILPGGLDAAWSQVAFSMDRFLDRGGAYDFAGAA